MAGGDIMPNDESVLSGALVRTQQVSGLEWPIPHHYRVIGAAGNGDAEHCMLAMHDGRNVLGKVLRLDMVASTLEFQVDTGTLDQKAVRQTIDFAAFKSIYLTRTIELEPQPVPSDSIEISPGKGRQKCTVHFKDGGEFEFDTIGIVERKAGLFLFMVNDANNIVRWFIPAGGIASYRTGDPLGKTLVDRKILLPAVIDAGLEKQQQLRTAKLGDYLMQQNIITPEQLDTALQKQKGMGHLRLGDVLVQGKLITSTQLDDALATQAHDRKIPLGEILVEMGAVSKETIRRALVEKLGVPVVNLRKFQCQPNAVKALSAELAHKHTVMPLYGTATRIAVALENPMDWKVLQELEFYCNRKIDPVLASRDDLLLVIAQFYGSSSHGSQVNISELVAELGGAEVALEPMAGEVVNESDNTLVRLVNKIIVDAIEQGASDIHIESAPGAKPSKVRLRKDGVMVPYTLVPPNFRAALISRLKIMGELDISEKRRPQDGKIKFEDFGPARVELRLLTIPTANGVENIVMRILSSPKALSLEKIGLSPRILEELQRLAVKPYGLLFVCGPTGSGKTTTLHSLLSYVNTPERKIWTAEDPIEITQDGLCQVQVNAKIGLTFPEVLRSFMRADPDVIMVGETRDPETAATVIAASLTGHLVMSTMHTNSAVESVVRLLDFGMDPFNFADAMLGIVGQRLVRRLCTSCREADLATVEEIDKLAAEYCSGTTLNAGEVVADWRTRHGDSSGDLKLHRAVGCEHCGHSGYAGRLGLHELLVGSEAVKRKIHARAGVAELTQTAMAEGMLSIKQDGIEKVLQGQTDMKQVQASCL